MNSQAVAVPVARAQSWVKLRDYLELTKPRIAVLELVTVAVAAWLAAWGTPDLVVLLHALVGTAFVAASASVWNHWLERDIDGRMDRTCERPLPTARLSSREAYLFGSGCLFAGLVQLAWCVNLQTAGLGLLAWVAYVLIYTPLKTRTTANTAVGAIAGAMPVLMGWSAMGGRWGLEAATLFLIVFLWQFPHFMAIAWLYRHDYAAGGLKMLSVVDPSGRRAGLQAVLAATALLPVSLLPALLQLGGPAYLVAALVLGFLQIVAAVRFALRLDRAAARNLLRMSLVYLPLLFTLLVASGWGLHQ